VDGFDVIIIIFFVVQFLHGLYQRVKGGADTTDAAQGAIMDALFDQDPPENEADEYAEYEIVIAHQLAQLEDALTESAELRTRLRAVRGKLRAIGGPTLALLTAVDETLLPNLGTLESRLTTLGAALAEPGEAAVEAYLANGEVVGEAYALLADYQLAAAVIEGSTTWRQDRELGPLLADADAIADALLAPLRRYTEAHDIPLPVAPPLCAPASPGAEAMIYGLLPDRPVVFVPTDFGGSIMRWPSIAHELGHVVWRALPGVRDEVTRLVGPPRSHLAVKADGRRFRVDHRAIFSAWMEEIFCDFFAALTLGPAALRGMVHSFAEPDEPQNGLFIHPSPYGLGLDEHPPAALRVALVAETLLRMGYTEEVRALQALWVDQHGEAEALFLPMDNHRTLRVRMDDFVTLGASLVQSLYLLPFSGLADAPWTAVHGLEMTPGVWSRVLRRAEDLVDDQLFDDDGRVVVAAGIEAADLKSGLSARISRGVRRAILGRGEKAPKGPEQHRVVPTSRISDPLLPAEIVESVILREVLHRKHTRRPHRRSNATPHTLAV